MSPRTSRTRRGLVASVAAALRSSVRPGTPGLLERGSAVPRLVRSVLRGDYPYAARSHLLALAAALLYVVSPVDLVPEALLGVFGLADDAVVVTWLVATLVNDTEAFLGWERSQARRASEGPQDAPHRTGSSHTGGGASGGSETVRSHVVC